jgi:seryl-tRNA synthetase
MLDPKLIRENPKLVEKKSLEKGIKINIDNISELDVRVRDLDVLVQKLREERNKLAKSVSTAENKEGAIAKGRELRERLEKQEKALDELKQEYQKALMTIPNLIKDDVKVGKDETENEVIRKFGTPTKFDFIPKDHLELGEALDIIDVKTAAKVSGPRFDYLKNDGVLLEFALKQFAFDTLIKEGFTPILPPVLIKKDIMDGLGYTQMGEGENIFSLDKDDFYLVATAEQSIVPMFKDEVLNKKDLPKRFVGFSTCFRREAGSYGKDTKGIFRVHQFNKVEMVSFVEEGKDDEEHEYLLSLEEKFFQALEIPYQVVKMCSGDLGFPAARKYDIEAWIPSQERYREVTSVSTVTDFQSRRLNMKYQDGAEKKYLNVLNGTAYSMNRPIIAILENFQQKDGSIIIPEVLHKYIGKKVIK